MKRRRKKKDDGQSDNYLLLKILKEIKKMAATIQDLRDSLTALTTAVDADLAQTVLVVAAINKLIAAIKANGTQDFSAEVAAVSAEVSKLAADNTAVQTALDESATV